MKASRLQEIIAEHVEFYGDTDVDFSSSGGEEFKINGWDHYKDSLYFEMKVVEEEDDV